MKLFEKYIIKYSATIMDALIALNRLSNDILTLLVVDGDFKMVGTVTDGDIRRRLVEGAALNQSIDCVMQTNFNYVKEGNVNVKEIKRYRELNIVLLPCLNSHNQITKVYNLKKKLSILPIDAVLMAGGKGERLRPLTESTPKPLLKVGDKAIIDYNIERLIKFGIENISVTVNYLKDQLIDHFNKKFDGLKIKCIEEPYYLGTLGSIKYVNNLNNEVVLVMNSDLFTNIDYEDFYLHFIENKADMSVAVIPYSVNIPFGIFELNGRNIQSVKEKPSYNYYANAGIYLIKRSLLSIIPDNQFYNATDLIQLLINKNLSVIRFPLTGYWIDIGKIEDYNKAKEIVKHLKSNV